VTKYSDHFKGKNHFIDKKEFGELKRQHRAYKVVHGEPTDWDHMTFDAEQVGLLLEHPDAVYFRVHKARYKHGGETLVLSAVDSDGRDILSNGGMTLMNEGTPCPPLCPPPEDPDKP
jgi:hypothetical protein